MSDAYCCLEGLRHECRDIRQPIEDSALAGADACCTDVVRAVNEAVAAERMSPRLPAVAPRLEGRAADAACAV